MNYFELIPPEIMEHIYIMCNTKSLISLSQTNKEFYSDPNLTHVLGKKMKWSKILKYHRFCENFLRKFEPYLDWKILSKYQLLNESFMLDNHNNIHWNIASNYQNITNKIISVIGVDKIDWNGLSNNMFISDMVFLIYGKYVNWKYLLKRKIFTFSFWYQLAKKNPEIIYDIQWNLSHQNFTPEFFIKLNDLGANVNWDLVLSFIKFSKHEKFLRYLASKNMKNDKFWRNISTNQQLSHKFMLDYKEYLYWTLLSSFQKFNNDILILISEQPYSSLVDWKDVCIYQPLDENIINIYEKNENINLSWNMISIHQDLNEQFIEKYCQKVNWNYISEYQKLSYEFIERHAEKLNWDLICKYQKLSYQQVIHWVISNEYILSKLNINNLKCWQNYTDDQQLELTNIILNRLNEILQNLSFTVY